jgi:hypothetical protein
MRAADGFEPLGALGGLVVGGLILAEVKRRRRHDARARWRCPPILDLNDREAWT